MDSTDIMPKAYQSNGKWYAYDGHVLHEIKDEERYTKFETPHAMFMKVDGNWVFSEIKNI
jgi:hypothetical protein